MAKKFICVEIGDRMTKVSVCLGTDKKRKIKEAFFYETPDGMVRDGEIEEPQEFAIKLRGELESRSLKDVKEIYFSIASPKIATARVTMPVATDPKIKSVVDNNKTDYFPHPLENYKVMFRVLQRADKKKNIEKSLVLVIAMPNDILTACLAISTGLEMKLCGVDAICSTLADGVQVFNHAPVTAFVHVDCTTTNIVFMKGKEFLLQRSLYLGGDDIISAYQEAGAGDSYQGKTEEEEEESAGESGDFDEGAEKKVKIAPKSGYIQALEELTDKDSAEENALARFTEDDVRELLDGVVGGIQRGIVFFQDKVKDVEVEQIFLVGPCAGLFGLEMMLEDKTEIDVFKMERLMTPEIRSIAETPEYYIGSMYSGLNGLNFGKDLALKKGKRATGGVEVDMPTAILLFILMSVFAVYWAYSIVLKQTQMENEIAKLESEILAMAYLDDAAAVHASYEASKDSLFNFTKMTENPNENLVQFLAELEAKMPSEILILSAGCTASSVNMTITVNSLVEAATVVSKLRTFESIAVIQVSGLGLSEVTDEYDEEYRLVNFSVVCNYGTNVWTAGYHPYADIIGVINAPDVATTG